MRVCSFDMLRVTHIHNFILAHRSLGAANRIFCQQCSLLAVPCISSRLLLQLHIHQTELPLVLVKICLLPPHVTIRKVNLEILLYFFVLQVALACSLHICVYLSQEDFLASV